MILLDTNIVGTFALVEAIDQLFALFAPDKTGVAPAVYAELLAGVREGRRFLQPVVNMIEHGDLNLFALTAEEVVKRRKLPSSLTTEKRNPSPSARNDERHLSPTIAARGISVMLLA